MLKKTSKWNPTDQRYGKQRPINYIGKSTVFVILYLRRIYKPFELTKKTIHMKSHTVYISLVINLYWKLYNGKKYFHGKRYWQ